jgi:NAD(P)-dependent dehydrogenase (short-subunit alcohol dehydrogenase family)
MRVVVTGAAGGIGGELCERLAPDHEVLALDRDAERLERVAGHERVRPVTVDLRDGVAVRDRLAEVDPDAVVSAVGWYELGALEDCSPAELREHLEVNLLGVHTVVHATLPALRERSGRLVVVGSIVGSVPLPHHGAYSASKAGLDGYTTALRRELAPRDVSVSLVEPGPVRTGLNRRAAEAVTRRTGSDYDEQYRAFEGYAPESTTTGAVADRVMRALTAESPRARYRVGGRARLLPRLDALCPDRLFDRIVRAGLPSGLLGRLIDR